MALSKDFPKSPYEILDPAIRWSPADEDLRKEGYGKLLPPLVHILRSKVNVFLDLHRKKIALENLINEKNKYIVELHQLNQRIQEQQKDLLEKEKLQSILEMAVTISHEFSQPLSVIIGYTDMLLNTMEKSDPLYNKLKKILDNGENLAELIRKVRSITNYRTITYSGTARMVDID